MAVSMLHAPSRASTSSSASFTPVSRQNTMSSHDGSRSVRQSKRYSVTALYLSMSAKDKELEIEDDLARGLFDHSGEICQLLTNRSSEDTARIEEQDLVPVEEELCP
jgi:Ras GTPase-activating-like protein IQGAP2/3